MDPGPIPHDATKPPAGWFWAGGVALAVFAARCREVQLYAGDVPYLDQWWVEGSQIIVPWLQGKLSWTNFFRTHHEHIPAWTRLFAWMEAAVLGRWDPRLQCTLNAALFGLVAGAWTGWLRRMLPLAPAFFLTLLTVALAALPHGWENSVWGFQSLVPVALLLVIWQVRGSFEREVNSPRWWLAQAAGIGALFTFGSMWTASVAIVITVFWTAAPGRRRWLAPALIGAAGLVLLLIARAHQPHGGAFALAATSPQQFLASFLVQLGWPSQWPGVAILMYLPALFLALQSWRDRDAKNIDRIALALALHAVAQAAAFAYGRAGAHLGFVSRYGDLLSLGVLANALALWRLLQAGRCWRPLLAVLAFGWLAAFGTGLNWISTRGHTEYFHGHAAEWAGLRRDAVKTYLTTGDAAKLATEDVRGVLYPDPAVVTSVLDQPGLRELLPVSVRPEGPRERGDFISASATYLRKAWPTLLTTASVLFLLGLGFSAAQRETRAAGAMKFRPAEWSPRLPFALALVAGAGVFLWPMPLRFHGEKRWTHLIAPADAVTNLSFLITTPTTYQVDNLTGGAALWPENFRNTFYGTHIDGPGFKGRAQSSTFPIRSPWLVVPYAGFPASAGNRLSLQIEDNAGAVLAEIPCPGPNPADIDFWAADVRAYAGRPARLVFLDGRNDAEGWLAAAPPQPASDGEQAARLRRAWALERTTSGHDSLGVIFVSLVALGALMALVRFRKIKQPNPTATIA